MIRVLVVDDSLFTREMLCCLLECAKDIEVAGTAGDLTTARRLIKRCPVDVLLIDSEMAGGQGRAMLQSLITTQGPPVILLTRLTNRSMEISLRAMEIGAFDVIVKTATHAREMTLLREQLHERIRAAASISPTPASEPSDGLDISDILPLASFQRKLIAIGTASGGTDAVGFLLRSLPETMPPIVIAQHLQEPFTGAMAHYLDARSPLTIRPLRPGMALERGHAYITSTSHPMQLCADGDRLQAMSASRFTASPTRSPMDSLFTNIAEHMGAHAMGVILSGSGADGAQGLLAMRSAGACTLSQSPDTCRASEMPRYAQALGAIEREVPLQELPRTILEAC
jgi:two-component system chemotaxis response regulator CheB